MKGGITITREGLDITLNVSRRLVAFPGNPSSDRALLSSRRSKVLYSLRLAPIPSGLNLHERALEESEEIHEP